MATLKHIAIKNKSYAFPLRYLTYQYDEKTNTPVLDENKHMVLREEYLIDAIGVTSPSTFQNECENWNLQCNKNHNECEIKLHHYIISFDPKDRELGLSLEKVQSIGMEIANKFFSGCQALICSHPDGHNKSGNMHVHIIVNSLRKETIQKPDFIERDSECMAGAKIRASRLSMNAMRQEIMDITQREKLNQVDLMNPPKDSITEREYRKTKREQDKLDAQNAEIEKDGIVPAKKEFQTEKEKIRRTVKRIIHKASNEEEFKKMLAEEGIEVTESRGRWGYKTATLYKPIRGRQLGTSYEKEYILGQLGSVGIIQDTNQYYGRLKKTIQVQNAINAADTMQFFVKNGLSGTDDLVTRLKTAEEEYCHLQEQKNQLWEKLNQTNRLIHCTGSYLVNKRYYNAWRQTPKEQREEYEIKFSAELANYKKANEELNAARAEYGLANMPNLDSLKTEKVQLMSKLEEIEAASASRKQNIDELNTLLNNYNKLLAPDIMIEQHKNESNKNNDLGL
nr:relaxase/mobilization nuclease domain-containing protein [uncultured Butyrivibrio sp.]